MASERLLGTEDIAVHFLREGEIGEILTDSDVRLRAPEGETLLSSLLRLGYGARIDGGRYPPSLRFEPLNAERVYPTVVFEKRNNGLKFRAHMDLTQNTCYLREISVEPERKLIFFALNTDSRSQGEPASVSILVEAHLEYRGLQSEPQLVWGDMVCYAILGPSESYLSAFGNYSFTLRGAIYGGSQNIIEGF